MPRLERIQSHYKFDSSLKDYFFVKMIIFVTGSCGFIGKHFVKYMYKNDNITKIIGYDKITYCSDINFNRDLSNKYILIRGDINDLDSLKLIFETYDIDIVIHFAAETHVCHSFNQIPLFIQTNIEGTNNLLSVIHQYAKIKKYIHISTDEVYGSKDYSKSDEKSLLDPTNPYSATKAAAEMIVKSYFYSFKMPIIIIRPNNAYGSFQYFEKIIPRFSYLLKNNKKMTIHGFGNTIRNFVHVLDIASAVEMVMEKGEIGKIYNIGSENEYSILEIANIILKIIKPKEKLEDWIEFSTDRPFNDSRYIIDYDELKKLGWKEQINFNEAIIDAVKNFIYDPKK